MVLVLVMVCSGFVGGEVCSAARRKVPNEVPHQLSTMNRHRRPRYTPIATHFCLWNSLFGGVPGSSRKRGLVA
jgi:hypothetical protein